MQGCVDIIFFHKVNVAPVELLLLLLRRQTRMKTRPAQR